MLIGAAESQKTGGEEKIFHSLFYNLYYRHLEVVVMLQAAAVLGFCFALIGVECVTQLAEETSHWDDVVHT